MCDLKAVEIILTFSVGGITLRGLIAAREVVAEAPGHRSPAAGRG